MQHTSIIAIIKKKKAAHNYGTVYIRGFFKSKPVAAISTGYKVLCTHWDAANRCVFADAPNARLVNACINKKLQEMEAQLLRIEIMGSNINRAHITAAIKGNDLSRDFINFCQVNVKQKYKNKQTIRSHTSEINKLKKFRSVISFSDVDFRFLCDYKEYLRDTRVNNDNTIWKTFKFLRTMTADALKLGGILQQDPFKEFDRGKYMQPDRVFLTIDECERILPIATNEHFPSTLRRVAIYFLLMCYSGLRYEDASSFDPAAHIIENDRLIRKTSKGAGSIVNIKLHRRLREIMELVKMQPLELSNQKFNQWLKLLSVYACIPKNLTCHTGRHTFGSLLAEIDTPIEKAQKLLGHADIKSTKVYYHITQKSEDEAIEKLNAL